MQANDVWTTIGDICSKPLWHLFVESLAKMMNQDGKFVENMIKKVKLMWMK